MGTRRRTGPERLRDAAVILPFAAVLLFAPPMLSIFAAPVRLWGLPLIVIYMFGAWALVVLAAALLARRLPRRDLPEGDPARTDDA